VTCEHCEGLQARAGQAPKVWVEIGPDDEDSLMAAGVLGEWDLGDRKAVGKGRELDKIIPVA
jgi:hypothetical protein